MLLMLVVILIVDGL